MSKIINKAEQERFRAGIMTFLASVGAKEGEHVLGYRHAIQTIYGTLNVKEPRYTKGTALVDVFCRFDEPGRAKDDTRCNQFTGKWNFHFLKTEIDEGISLFQQRITEILNYFTNMGQITSGNFHIFCRWLFSDLCLHYFIFNTN